MRFQIILSFLSILGFLACDVEGSLIEVQNETASVTPELVTDQITNPWGMTFLPDGDILVTEKSGSIVRISNGQVINKDVTGGPQSITRGQGGLLDIELHPDFDNNQWVYFTFASAEGEGNGAMTALSRAQWNGTGFENHAVLYKGSPNTTVGQHFGSRIAFDNDSYVYFSIGDRGNRDNNPQDITLHFYRHFHSHHLFENHVQNNLTIIHLIHCYVRKSPFHQVGSLYYFALHLRQLIL